MPLIGESTLKSDELQKSSLPASNAGGGGVLVFTLLLFEAVRARQFHTSQTLSVMHCAATNNQSLPSRCRCVRFFLVPREVAESAKHSAE